MLISSNVFHLLRLRDVVNGPGCNAHSLQSSMLILMFVFHWLFKIHAIAQLNNQCVVVPRCPAHAQELLNVRIKFVANKRILLT